MSTEVWYLTVLKVPSRQATVQEVGTGGPLLPRAGVFLHHEEPPGVITAAAVIILDEETPLQISVTDENRKINYKYGNSEFFYPD